MNEKKKTVGAIVYDILTKEPELLKDPMDEVVSARQEALKDYQKKLENTIEEALKVYPGGFYIVSAAKVERVFKIVIRNLIFHAPVCPTPNYDQTIYKYHRRNDEIEFLWSIPDKRTCEWMKTCPLDVPEEHHNLRQTVFDFYDDTLLHRVEQLNHESESPINLVEEIYG